MGPSEQELEEMMGAYVTCALWSTNDNADDSGGEPLDKNYTSASISESAYENMALDVECFATENYETLMMAMGTQSAPPAKLSWGLAGHDLWLTRNGHGCGFRDGDWPEEAAEILTASAKKMGEVYLYVGDNGEIDDG